MSNEWQHEHPLEDEDVSVPFDDEPDEQQLETSEQPARFAPSPLDGLSLELTVRSGNVSLNLNALQHLAPGSVLGISGVTPGEATLCHGERVVAHGELVDVDGRLGLQITRVVFDR